MIYEKGSFVVIPNKQHLKGKPSEMQSVYFWLCEHADEKGQCYPSRKTLAKESGTGMRSIDKYLLQLEKHGFVKKIKRKKEDNNANLSNLYQILIIEDIANKDGVPSSKNYTTASSKNYATPSSKKDAVTISNINYNQLTEKSSLLKALKKNKGLIKQKIRVQYINNDMLATEEEVEEVMDTIVKACKEQTPQEFRNTLTMYGLA